MNCVTLLSDFGLQDASVAIAKGVLLQHNETATIIDISHDVIPFQLGQAAYLLSSAYKNFPTGTCHVLLFDLFSANTPHLLLCEQEGQYFLTPDNGLLPLALGTMPAGSWLCYELPKQGTFIDWLHAAAKTCKQLITETPYNLGLPEQLPLLTRQPTAPTQQGNTLVCEVLHTDHYGNAVLNLTKHQFDTVGRGRQFRLQFVQTEVITELSTHYQDVRYGYKLCRFNSIGYMEICMNRGKAASNFGLRPGSKRNDIKLTFE